MANQDRKIYGGLPQEKFTSNTPTIWDVTSLSASFFYTVVNNITILI